MSTLEIASKQAQIRPPHVLLIRLSALGDVVMLLPVVKALRETYPEIAITILSSPFVRPLFEALHEVRFVAADTRHKHKGIVGIWRLATALRQEHFTHIADTHSVLRTWLLRFFLRLLSLFQPYKLAAIDKGRKEKKALTRPTDKRLIPLEHSVKRYADVLSHLGYPLHIPYLLGGLPDLPLPSPLLTHFEATRLRVGIAPFAKHRGKIYDLDRMRLLIDRLERNGILVFLFGSQGKEAELLQQWATSRNIIALPTYQLNLLEEIAVIRHLDLMLTMDSANMHLASWAGTRTLSIWGATHRFAGFYGWGQSENLAVEKEELSCRPCSVYGNSPCMRGDYACLNISVEELYKRILLELPTSQTTKS